MATQTLGYYDLMNIAEQNSEQSQRDASKLKLPSYKGSKNKKEDPKSKALSDNVRKFLAKKEEEKRREEEEQRKKREHLLEMRSKDKKAKGRVNRMLKLTKSANKSAIEDANDCLNDSIVDQHDELQPDDDDYGYVSQASIDMHKRLLEQYKTIKKSTPAPVSRHHSLPVPEVQSLSSKSIGGEQSNPKAAEKKTRKQPPKETLSYHDLLNLANEKKDIPPEFPVMKATTRKECEEFDYGRPMTAKEKAAYEAEKTLRDRVMRQVENGTFRHKPANDGSQKKGPVTKSQKTDTFKIPVKSTPVAAPLAPSTSLSSVKVEVSDDDSRGNRKQHQTEQLQSQKVPKVERMEKRKSEDAPRPLTKVKIEPPEKPVKSVLPLNPYMDFVPVVQPRRNQDPKQNQEPKHTPSGLPDNHPHRYPQHKEQGHLPQKPRPSSSSQRPAQKDHSPPPMKKPKLPLPSRSHNENQQHRNSIPDSKSFKQTEKSRPKGREINHSDRGRDDRKEFEDRRNSKSEIRKKPGLLEQRQAPKNYSPPPHPTHHDRRDSRMEPPRNYPPPEFDERRRSKVPESSMKKGRQVIESDEEEYDSEMDDFIDDSDCNPARISDMIRQITGYDKRRYRPEDEGECMETSAYDQMREESRSLRIGIKEDLEDMRLEEEERKRKLGKQKQPSSSIKKKSK